MKRFAVASQKDLYVLKETANYYDEIDIELNNLKIEGLIRHAVKYSVHALKIDGIITIKASPFGSYVLRRNKIDFWQVKYEVFGSLKDSVELVELDNKEGRLVLKKKKHLYNYNGISFGIVFSGNKQEELQLIKSIETIGRNKALTSFNCEILICGPSDYNPSTIKNTFPGLSIEYLSLDISTSPRLMICEKKNLLYKKATYNLVVISHSRILFSEDFVAKLLKYPVEMVTPAIYFRNDNKNFKYLDIAFIDSYQDIQLGAKRGTIAGENIQSDYLHWYRKRVPFIDGGLNVFNKEVIANPPYNNYISWGEAEDVDLCNRLYQDGVLIDYLPAIECYSATCKVTGYSNIKTIARRLINQLHKKKIIN